jgi:hypothetical protein
MITQADRGLRAARTYLAAAAAAVLVTALVAGTGAPPAGAATTQQADAAQVHLSGAQAIPAPVNRKGGVLSPVAWCESDQIEPTIRWTLWNTKTGWARTWEWSGSLPNMHFPRVDVGRYKSRTVATCDAVTTQSTHGLRVKEKTRAGTVSHGEWQQIRRGMTRAKVAAIVGNNGRDATRWNGRTTVTYDMMPFWRWSQIVYRNGRVVAKYWDVGHD